jgi:hypothetical protein
MGSSFAAFRKLVRPRAAKERCELCGEGLPPEHAHLVEPGKRSLHCACQACALLFSGTSGRYRRVPRRIEFLPGFRLSDELWEGLHIPINLAFFFRDSSADRVLAMYPSPAGATESLLSLESWQDLIVANPVLREFEADVEALLVNRVGPTRECYRVPIDQCYKLVGLIRAHWRGLSGGTEVWKHVGEFFAQLKSTDGATPERPGETTHA